MGNTLLMCETMDKTHTISTKQIVPLFLKLVEEGLAGNTQRLELLSLNAVRTLRAESPDLAQALGALVAKFAGNGSALRLRAAGPPPADADAGLALLRIQPVDDAKEPVLTHSTHSRIERFLIERIECEKLLKQGFAPPRTLLLQGMPGTGKTMLAKWMALRLGLPLVVLDLATSISSFLGKTGANLRRSLDYARATPCVLLLDEFDAIGKRRDDAGEVGELKRIVNVLLKELEDWPFHSVLVAATNHPELLDPAINRRFDVVIELSLPGEAERLAILQRACGQFTGSFPDGFLVAISRCLEGCNGSEIDTLSQSVVRRHVIEGTELPLLFVDAVVSRKPSLRKEESASLSRLLKETTNLTVREIGHVVGKSSSAVQYQLTKKRPARRKQNA